MSATINMQEVLIRLGGAILAGALIGLNREAHHHGPAGLRTTILVCAAASLSMIQVNLLLATAGKPANSFVVLDLMRLPLGVLSGMGFIGAGAILRRGNAVRGVTTAATLWFVTMVGLCLGAGELVLGAVATAIALAVLRCLKLAERAFYYERHATLVIECEPGDHTSTQRSICATMTDAGCRSDCRRLNYVIEPGRCQFTFDVRWRRYGADRTLSCLAERYIDKAGVKGISWTLTDEA